MIAITIPAWLIALAIILSIASMVLQWVAFKANRANRDATNTLISTLVKAYRGRLGDE